MLKKGLSVLLVLVMVLTAIPLTGLTTFATTSGDWEYSESDGIAQLYKYNGSATEVTIPSTIDGNKVTIVREAFMNCDFITSVTVPESVEVFPTANESISSAFDQGIYSFYGCTSLESIYVSDGNNNFSSYDGALYNKEKTKLLLCPEGKNSIDIPDSVDFIATESFSNCTLLKSVKIPEKVTWIGDWAFSKCVSLTGIKIPDSVTYIGYYAFKNCESLKSIIIPDSVTGIGDDAFENCELLTIYGYAGSYAEIYANENGYRFVVLNSEHSSESDYSYTVIDDMSIEINKHNGTSTNVIIPAQIDGYLVTSLFGIWNNSGYSFESIFNPEIESVTIPETVMLIGNYAFLNTSITSISIPDSVTNIGEGAFEKCNSLTNAKISKNITQIPEFGFSDCTVLSKIEFSNSVTKIGYAAFRRCNSLTDVYFDGTADEWNNISIESGNDCLTNATVHCLKETAQNGFIEKNGNTYYYVDGSYLVGLQEIDGNRYFFAYEDGRMCRNEEYDFDGVFYIIDENGFVIGTRLFRNGWIKENGKKYYYEDDAKLTGWQIIGGKKYYLGTDGAMRTGWQNIKNSKGVSYRYYFGTNGCMVTGWQKIANSKGVKYTYYFHTNGVMLTGWQKIKNAKGVAYQYYFNPSNGVMLTGWQKIKNSKGVAYQYYFHTNGVMLTGWQNIKNSKGVAYKYYFGANGVMRTGWQWIANAKGVKYRYYFGTNGYMRTGWQNIKASNGKTYKYYFYNNGVNAINRNVKIGNKTYKFNKYGICTNA